MKLRLIKALKRYKFKLRINTLLFFKELKIKYLLPLGIIDKSILKEKIIPEWEQRIRDVVECADNMHIARCPDAGQIRKGKQVMHNGIEITLGGYYGNEIAQLLYRNKGVHEPQEEYAFDLVLKKIPQRATMIELGCYWSFYSMWFLKTVKDGRSFLIEPDRFNLQYGINNFRLNKLAGDFTNAYIAGKTHTDDYGVITMAVPDFLKEKQIDFVDILHSDIQGYEYEMLLSLKEMMMKNKVGYFFISTHGNEIHYKCLNILKESGYIILCHADDRETYSYDGLIVARSPQYEGIDQINISKKGVLL